MKNIVKVKGNELFVTIGDIAKFSGYEITGVQDLINRHKGRLNIDLPKGSYKVLSGLNLTERQATHLIILMKNTDEVLNFKDSLIEQFFSMRESACIANTKQLDIKNKQIKKLSSSVYAKPRGGGLETVTRIIRDYGIKATPHDLNILLCSVGLLSSEDRIVEHFVSSTMNGDVALVHVDTVLSIVDDAGMDRDLGYSDTHPSLFKDS